MVEESERLGFGLEAIWARLDLAEVSPHRARSQTILEQARERAAALGALTEQRMAERALRSIGVRAWRRGTASGDDRSTGVLTEREWEVAHLVRDGASNPEIAAKLFVSRKTVESHLSKILTRLGLRNRTELARWVSERLPQDQGTPR